MIPSTDSFLESKLAQKSATWVITGVAGFIGSNLLQTLLEVGQQVVGLDSFVTGHQANLDDVRAAVGPERWSRFRLVTGDIADPQACARACAGGQYLLHQAALGSVPRSISQPLATHQANVTGFVTILEAARAAGIRRVVYASSSSVYGDHPQLPKREDQTGRPLSPYAATKAMNELYADVWSRTYGMECIGLRYFNVFGRRQDPQGAYAAVMPRWIATMLRGERCVINGAGDTSRDFCYIANVCQANLKAALTDNVEAVNKVYNIAYGNRMTLIELHEVMRQQLPGLTAQQRTLQPEFVPYRPGDIRHSLADISQARQYLGYEPQFSAKAGLHETLEWYARQNDVLA